MGRSFYVATDGTDLADGSSDNPYATISHAVSQLGAGDTLYVREGRYYQPGAGAVFANSGTAAAQITVQGLGVVTFEGTGTNTYAGISVASNMSPAFDTNGHDYINFNNFTVKNLRAGVKVSTGSSYVTLDGVSAERNHFGLLVDGADHVFASNMKILNCRYGIRTDATAGVIPKNLEFDGIDVSGSKNVYPGWEFEYRNGDGFIFEYGDNITVRNSESYNNWDAGFDIKATNVTLEAVNVYRNHHQGLKVWGTGILVRDSLIRDNMSNPADPAAPEGWGLNQRGGSITVVNSTFSNNYAGDIRTDDFFGPPSVTYLVNCIIARKLPTGRLRTDTSRIPSDLKESNNVWYNSNESATDFKLNSSSLFADPLFVDWDGDDYHLQAGSPAVALDAGAFDIGG
jgi:signal peptidase I